MESIVVMNSWIGSQSKFGSSYKEEALFLNIEQKMENIVFHKNGIQNNNSKRVSFLNEVTRSSSFILDGLVDRNREMARS